MVEEVKPVEQPKPESVTAETNSTAETIEVTNQVEEQMMVTIPKKQYDELVAVNDSAFIAIMDAYNKFDEIIGSIMNLNILVFNKKKELKDLISNLNRPQVPTDESKSLGNPSK